LLEQLGSLGAHDDDLGACVHYPRTITRQCAGPTSRRGVPLAARARCSAPGTPRGCDGAGGAGDGCQAVGRRGRTDLSHDADAGRRPPRRARALRQDRREPPIWPVWGPALTPAGPAANPLVSPVDRVFSSSSAFVLLG